MSLLDNAVSFLDKISGIRYHHALFYYLLCGEVVSTSSSTSSSSSLYSIPRGAKKMARFGLGFVRRVVKKWKSMKGRDNGMGWDSRGNEEWKEPIEQKATTTWNSNTNEEWSPSMDQKAGMSWVSHSQPLPGEANTVGKPRRDSGYFEDTPSESSKADPTRLSDNPSESKYLQLPFRTKHYFLAYVQRILEATCLRYAQKNLRHLLTDPEWKKLNLIFPSNDYPPDRFVGRDWLAEDEIELETWMIMLAERARIPTKQRIFESVIDLRNATVHRGDRGDLDFEKLSYAMAFPGWLRDSKGESDITAAFRYVMEDPTLDDDTKARVEDAMYTPQPCTTHYQLLARLQSMLEETCFRTAARTIPHVLAEKNWHMPEQIELQNWHDIFQKAGLHNIINIKNHNTNNNDDDSATQQNIFPNLDPRSLLDLLGGARIHIRIIAAHRLPLSDEKLASQVQRAINIAVLQGDWSQAIEIEILAEGYFTKKSRKQVLERLEGVYKNGGIGSLYERGRRIAIAGTLEREGGGMGEAEVVVSGSCDVVGVGEGRGWVERMWSPSMWEGLKRVEVL